MKKKHIKQTLRNLRQLHFLLSQEEVWRKGFGDERYCLGDGVSHILSIDSAFKSFRKRKDRVLHAMGFDNIDDVVAFNDNKNTIFRGVLERINIGIEKMKAKLKRKK